MVDIKLIILGGVVIILILALATVFNIASDFESQQSYVEITLDDPQCSSGLCLDEYFIVSNGLILKKSQDSGGDVEIEIRSMGSKKASEIIDEISKAKIIGREFDDKSAQYHIYTVTDSFDTTYCEANEITCKDLFSKLKSAYETSTNTNESFIQLVYWRVGEDIDDYHLFGDGTAIHSKFTPKSELLSSRTYRLDENTISEIGARLKNIGDFGECKNENIIYGYLLIYDGMDTIMINTCGSGSSAADDLYNYLIQNV